jgi:hypothetical protein
MVCIENNMMNYLFLPLNCEQGKCPSFIFTITWSDSKVFIPFPMPNLVFWESLFMFTDIYFEILYLTHTKLWNFLGG